MASGRYHPNKNGRSEPRRQSNWQRSVSSDYDDVQSLNSLGSDIRINNWDFSDLRPSSLSGNSKHHKKSKGNPEREREQSLSADSPPHDKKTHTPSSYPRTKITPDTPTSQRVALENLKQHMTFSDVDDLEQQGSTDGDRRARNNEQQISKSRRRVQNPDLQADSAGARDSHRNNNTDFLSRKQGKRADDLEEVHRLIRNLQEQEQGYRGLLHKSLGHHVGDEAVKDEADSILQAEGKDDSDDDDGSVDLEVQSQESENSETMDSRPRIESKLGIDSDKEVDEGDNSQLTNRSLTENLYSPLVASYETAENTGDTTAATDGEASSEYRQELLRILQDKQQQLQSLMVQQDQLNIKRREMEKKLVAAKARDNTVSAYMAALNVGRQVLEHDQPSQRSSQRSTNWEVNENGTTERGAVGESRQLKSNIVGYPESDDEEDNSKVRVVENLPTDFLELRRQLNYLKNEHSRVSGSSKNMEADAVPPLAEGYEQLQNKLHQLQSKKHHMDMLLQEFQKLQAQPFSSLVNNKTNSQASNIQTTISSAASIPESQHQQSDNGVTSHSSDHSGFYPNSQTRVNETTEINPRPFESFVPTFGQTTSEAPSAHTNLVLEMREKLRRLREVRAQLDQLSSGSVLRQAESKQTTASPGNKATAASPPSQQPHLDHPQIQQQQKLHMKQMQQAPKERPQIQQQQGAKPGATSSSSLRSMAQLLNLAGSGQGEDEHSDEDNASVFQSELQWSHLGHWNDDPEIQEKVRKLKSAKEKLQQLQDLVALVQQSPDAAGTGPETNMGDLATGDTAMLPDRAGAGSTLPADGEHLRSESDDVQHRDSELDDIQDPRAELVRLRKERAMLLELQNQLRHIQNQATSNAERREDEGSSKQNSDVGKTGLTPTPTTTVVTFASNDELYSKIRRQRILHEELRSRKRELEAFMTKDRNKKQYSRNQDNQSDVSLNTDAYGNAVSVDATMATWGGSTVDNLENITEDFDRQERCGNHENEGYQSDGINEMEEEEEEEGDTDQGNYPTERSAGQRTGSSSNLEPHLTRPGDRQTYSQPSYSERYVKPSKTHVKDRKSPSRQDMQPRSESQEYRQGDGDGFERKHSEWFRAIESRLSGLGSAVDMLFRRSETESRQLHVSLSHESALHNGGLMSPMQDQMLQLQNQSLMLSFSQLVQSVSRQQGDIQQLQQQVQALHIQMQSLHLERSFHSGPLTGSSAVHAAQPHPAINSSSNYSLHATGAVATHGLTLNHQQVSAPFIQNNQNNSLENFPVNGLGLQNFVGHSTQDLHHGMERRPGSTASSGSVPNLRSITSPKEMVASFNANETRQSGSRLQQNSVSRDMVSIPAATIDDAQFVDHQQPVVSRHGNGYSDVRRFGALPRQRNSAGSFHHHFLKEEMNKKPGSEDSTQGSGSILLDKSRNKKRHADGASNGGTTFDTLRDTIYTEAASLISQNENRPHFLLELFRDMQQINSDVKRHRVLYSVQEVLRLTPNAYKASPFSIPSWSQVAAGSTKSGRTSSENAVSEDDNAHIKLNCLQEEIITLERGRLERQAKNAPFDDAEAADNMSSLSTPTDGGDEFPFFKDTLGETVLDFDSLKKAGEERQQLFNKIFNKNVDDNGTWRSQRYLAGDHGTVSVGRSGMKGERRDKSKINQMASGIAVDQANEFLESGMAYPRIDMKQLDGQIKDIMMKTIPLVKEHMEDVCSVQLLNYIRCLVISLTSQMGSRDFVRFFQHQLASVLEETLQKFEGRKMKDCGEDLLVGVSDVLYNELAFFRLMENMDSGNKRSSPIEVQVSEDGSISDVTATSGTSGDEDENTGRDNNVDGSVEDSPAVVTEHRTAEYKQEQIRMHQDRTINKADIQDPEERDEPEQPPYKIELAPSETKPFTRIGSDEDDDEGDEEWSLSDPSETAVSRDSMLETSSRSQLAAPPGATPATEVSHEEEGAEKQDLESEKQEREKPSSPLVNGTLDTENPGNIDGVLATGDLPERLAVPNLAPAPEVNSDPTEVQHRYEDEQASLSGLDAILASLGGMEELAGDESLILDPDSFQM